MKSKTLCVIMGGGRGTRLFPLTAERCKPAVPLAGKYRLVDIPISNCLNSGLNQIFVLTQFNTASLHRHIQGSYKFDHFGRGFVDILSAEQTDSGGNWYQGTADAVRQNLHHLNPRDEDLILILSGDQLYQMDLKAVVEQHRRTGADLTIAAKAMPTNEVAGLGLMRIAEDLTITEFVEKPSDPAIIEGLAIHPDVAPTKDRKYVLANMGIYVFSGKSLRMALDCEHTDFGKEIIPQMLGRIKQCCYVFNGYWEDIGTVRSFFDANLQLTDSVPPFNFFDIHNPVYTRARYLPASKLNNGSFDRSIVADGCIISGAQLRRTVIGIRSIIREGTCLENVVMMGADSFVPDEDQPADKPRMGVGRNCHISNAIIDKNARIGDNVKLSPEGKPDMFQQGDVIVRDGVLIVLKNGVVPSGTVI